MRRCFGKFTPLIAGLLAGLLFAILVVPLIAQPAREFYNVREEVTLSGTVSSVLRGPAPGMIWGGHLMIDTLHGKVDASLGRWGLEGKGAPTVKPGQQVEVTGIIKTVRNKEVLVTRTLKVNGKIYAMRTQHGIAVSPQARQRAAEKGEGQ